MKIKKIVFIIPNTRWFGHKYWDIYPYSICLLASIVRDQYDVELIDLNMDNLDFEKTISRLRASAPDIVGISLMAAEYKDCAHKTAALVKEALPSTITIIGGVYATSQPKNVIADLNIDYAVLGEGEDILPKLLDAIVNKIRFPEFDGIAYRNKSGEFIIKPQKIFIDNLDALPLPAFDLLPIEKYLKQTELFSHVNARKVPFAKLLTSRGCPNRCTFCDLRSIQGNKFRPRSAKNVLAEIDWLVEHYQVKEIIFNDDNLIANPKRAKEIFHGLIKRNYDLIWKSVNIATYALNDSILDLMAQSGCYQVTLAIESGSDEVLKNLMQKPLKTSQVGPVVKKAKQLSMEVAGLFMLGMPGETWEQIRQTISFAEKLELDYVHFGIATPMPNTELYKTAKEHDLLVNGFDVTNFSWSGYGRGVIKTDQFDPFDLEVLRVYEWDRINFATLEKKEKLARMMNVDLLSLEKWRKETRASIISRYTNKKG